MKKIKGFTLIELIIVMAIMTILMAAIMQMMKPIRSTYLDSTFYESQRNTQNGMVQYLTESLRYATNLGIYNQNAGATTLTSAINDFKAATGITDESQIKIITIDNKTAYTYNNETCYGRIIKSKALVAPATSYTEDAAKAGTTQGRLALGNAYYGPYNYSINVVLTGTELKVSIASLLPNALNSFSSTDNITSQSNVLTEGDVVCRNLSISGNKTDITKAGTSTTTQGTLVYIIYTE